MRFFGAAVLLVTSLLFTQPVLAQSRVALVIGNGAYEKVPELPNPTRDAADIGRALERLDFKVTQVKNVTAQEMRKAVVEFGRSAEAADLAVVFYAGHGMEVGGENWLIPISAELRSDTDIESEAISLRSVSLQVSKARKLGLVILDACRNNPFAAKMKRSISTRAVARGLAPTEPSDNVLIAYAARDGTTASDGDGRNSPFTASLLRHIETPGLEISFLFRRVRDDVMAATKREQQPFVYGSLSKDEIYLKAPAASAPAPVAFAPAPAASAPAPANPAEDEKFWLAIQTSTVAGLYEDFLARYPRSSHAEEARRRIKNFKANEVAALASPAAPPKSDATGRQGSDVKGYDVKGSDAKGSDAKGADVKTAVRNLFAPEDNQKVIAIAAAQKLELPSFTISPDQNDPLNANSKFVGVWSNKRGWTNGMGRYAMLIVTQVSATGLAKGYYLWGPPTKQSWAKDAAGYKVFAEYIENDKFSINGTPVTVKLDKNVLALSSFKKEDPSETASIELRPVWQLVPAPEQAEPSTKREKVSQPRAAKKESAAEPSPPSNASGTSMEERYRACRKLVKGFAQRDACARNGTI
ncbi:caspase family protein [Bradyrhizobium sp. CB1717]|uniref:caspase family protein n=1 Tax=Bradyrhizobium sp. CB1717 TaxID=3039154 RepID=UPI0024B0AD9F|nr:caspase family protein [Bradyrhizobium sp. CB1717]WFU25026.1 caspase family protein [Bradyrhizobium sp. CB1717]